MPIFKGDNWQHLYKGDGHPAALYKGSKKLAGWTEESQAGVSHAYFEDTYNDKADVVIHGKSSQVETTGAQLIDFSKSSFLHCSLENANTGTLKLNVTDFFYCCILVTYLNEYLLSKRGETITLSAIDGIPEKMMSIVIYGTRADGKTYQEKYSTLGGNLVSLTVEQDFETITGVELRFGIIRPQFTDTNTLVTGVMLNTGNTAIPFEPYTGGAPSPSPDYPQEITSVGDGGSVEVVSTGAQLVDWEFKSGDFGSFTKTDENYTLKQGGLTVNTTRSFVKLQKYDGEKITDTYSLFSLGDKKTFVFTKDSTFKKIRFGFNGNKVDTIIEADASNLIDGEKYTVSFNFVSNEVNAGIIDKIILSKGDTWHDFEPYRSSTATFSTPNGLPGIPVDSGGNYTDEDGQQWICDEIDTKAGVYRQRVGKVQYVGDTSEAWDNYPNEKYKGFYIKAPDRKIAAFNPGTCNRFRVDMTLTSTDPGIWIGSTSLISTATDIYFHNCNPSIASSLEEWRTWLSTHNVTVLYPLATPVETPLSDAVDTFLGGTNLFISEHEMDVTVKTEDQANPTGA